MTWQNFGIAVLVICELWAFYLILFRWGIKRTYGFLMKASNLAVDRMVHGKQETALPQCDPLLTPYVFARLEHEVLDPDRSGKTPWNHPKSCPTCYPPPLEVELKANIRAIAQATCSHEFEEYPDLSGDVLMICTRCSKTQHRRYNEHVS